MATSLLNVAMLQLAPPNDTNDSLVTGLEACRRAKSLGADIAVFPEIWNTGYRFPSNVISVDEWKSWAVPASGTYVRSFRQFAAENDIAIALTFLRAGADGRFYNSVVLIDRHGQPVLAYDKVHTCDFSRESTLTPGGSFAVCDLDTRSGLVKIGAMICFDREFPESARILMLQGAEIVIVPNACTVDLNRKCQLRTRAFENMTGYALVNYAGDEYGGGSVAFDGIAFAPGSDAGDGPSRDMQIAEAGTEPAVTLATFDLDALRDYRSREVWANAYRRPALYQALVEDLVAPPFVRADARRAQRRSRTMDIVYRPIGIIHSPFAEAAGTPIQPAAAAGARGSITLDPEYGDGLRDLAGFSHIVLLYHFHRSTGYSLEVVPFLDTQSHGVFATRAPKRPNAIGLSVVRLVSMNANELTVENIDILDGTPLLDIKPYIPEMDVHPADRTGWFGKSRDDLASRRADRRFE